MRAAGAIATTATHGPSHPACQATRHTRQVAHQVAVAKGLLSAAQHCRRGRPIVLIVLTAHTSPPCVTPKRRASNPCPPPPCKFEVAGLTGDLLPTWHRGRHTRRGAVQPTRTMPVTIKNTNADGRFSMALKIGDVCILPGEEAIPYRSSRRLWRCPPTRR